MPSGGGSRIIQWEEALDTQLVERDVLWRACSSAPIAGGPSP
jgi:hypothetical protein